MNSIKELVEPQCGQSNALVDLANRVLSINEKQKNRFTFGKNKEKKGDLVSEFLAQYVAQKTMPSTFDIATLLRSLRELNPMSDAKDWIIEYNNETLTKPIIANEISQQSAFERTWQLADDHFYNASKQKFNLADKVSTSDVKWSVEYLMEAEQQLQLKRPPMHSSIGQDDHSLWVDEFTNFLDGKLDNDSVFDDQISVDEACLTDTWKEIQDVDEWIKEYTKSFAEGHSSYNDYEFNNSNPYKFDSKSLEAGKAALAIGDLANAVLYFEAAVTQEPENAEAWQYLGQAQAENEHEAKTIAALKTCLKFEPKNLNALAMLATAYTNEALYMSGCKTLLTWLQTNPKYSSGAASYQMSRDSPSTFLDKETFRSVESLFLEALKHQGPVIDADLQNALGVLYNMSGDMDKAVDCFRTALSVQPNDARLWNRLGATLANDKKSAEAVYAYRKALELYPAFVRARYNLGVSCHNLGSHEQAVDHFVSALALQQNGIGPKGQIDMSQTIWSTLRLASASLSRSDVGRLLEAVDERNFERFKQHFYQPASL